MIVAIVLGAAVRPDGTPSATLRLRVNHAVNLYKTKRAQLLIFTGSAGEHGPPEALVSRDLAVSLGIPAQDIRTEIQSRSTVENLFFARSLLPPDAKPVIVSNRWHLPRACLAAQLMGLRVTGSGPQTTSPTATTVRAVLREAVATPSTILKALQARQA